MRITASISTLGPNRENFVRTATNELEHALAGNARRDEVLDGFHALGSDRQTGAAE